MTRRQKRNTASRRARLLIGAFGAISGIVVFGAGAAFAYWAYTDSSNANDATAVANMLPQGATPGTPTVNAVNGSTVSFSFSQVSTTSPSVALTSYTVTRYPAAGGSGTVTSASCSITSGTVNCSEINVPSGTWVYADTPFLDNWVGIESAKSPSVIVDATTPTASAPSVTATVTHGTNPIWVNGKSNESVTLTDSPTDVGGTGVASVAYYYCPSSAGSCTSGTPWILIGSSSSSGANWSFAWSSLSLPADGTYNVVAVATGNNTNVSSPSAATLVGIDTTPPNVSQPIVNGHT